MSSWDLPGRPEVHREARVLSWCMCLHGATVRTLPRTCPENCTTLQSVHGLPTQSRGALTRIPDVRHPLTCPPPARGRRSAARLREAPAPARAPARAPGPRALPARGAARAGSRDLATGGEGSTYLSSNKTRATRSRRHAGCAHRTLSSSQSVAIRLLFGFG